MQDLINTFLEEAAELLADLEEALLTLEDNPQDSEAINRVFRVMHTLKGSGSMFGYEAVSDFTHKLESLYDLIRNKQLELSTAIFNLTLAALDHLRNIFKAEGKMSEELVAKGERLQQQVSELLAGGGDTGAAQEEAVVVTEEGLSTYFIVFKPNADILMNGTKPLYLLDELASFGKTEICISSSHIPDFTLLDPEKVYVEWKILLSTAASLDDIVDIFIFVDDSATVEVQRFADYDFLALPETSELVAHLSERCEEVVLADLEHLADEHKGRIRHNPAAGGAAEQAVHVEPDQKEDASEQRVSTPDLPEHDKKAEPKIAEKQAMVRSSSIRVSSNKIEELMNLVSELVTNQAGLELYARRTGNPELLNAVERNEKLIRRLRDNALEISLIPISILSTRFKRLIRDLSRELKKDIEFIISGTDTELDKAIIDQLAEPILHILRNAADHGIESAEERRRKHKPDTGRITLHSYYSGSDVVIEIQDDGRGIDFEAVRRSAINKGLIEAERQLSREEIVDLLFRPGFSTAKTVSDISGRGVGMDVVKKKITELRGTVKAHSTPGKGTTFIITLPLTLSIIDAIQLRVGDQTFILDISSIQRIYRITARQIEESFNRMLTLDGVQYPFMEIRKEFNIAGESPEHQQAILLKGDHYSPVIIVDYAEREVQVVVKPISGSSGDNINISGASIMGDGTIALVLDAIQIINHFKA